MATKLNKIISDPEWNLYNASRAEVSFLWSFACMWGKRLPQVNSIMLCILLCFSVSCDFVTLEQRGSRSERFESLTGKLTKIINGPVWKLYNFSRAEVSDTLQGMVYHQKKFRDSKEEHAINHFAPMLPIILICISGGAEQANHSKCNQGSEAVWGHVQVHISPQVPL